MNTLINNTEDIMGIELEDLEKIQKYLVLPMETLLETKMKSFEDKLISLQTCIDDRTNPDKVRTRWQSGLVIAATILALIANFRPYLNTATLVNKPDIQIEHSRKGANNDAK